MISNQELENQIRFNTHNALSKYVKTQWHNVKSFQSFTLNSSSLLKVSLKGDNNTSHEAFWACQLKHYFSFLCVDKKINQLLFFVLKGIRCKICWSFTIVSHSTYDNFFSILLPFSTSILDFMPHTKSCTRNERWNENETVFMWVCRYIC